MTGGRILEVNGHKPRAARLRDGFGVVAPEFARVQRTTADAWPIGPQGERSGCSGPGLKMDEAHPPGVAQRRKRNRIIAGAAAALLVVVTTVALARLRPAAPTVEAGGLWIEPVKRGTMLRNVRGVGVLVPDEIGWITALTDGTVERVVVLPGRRQSRHGTDRAHQPADPASSADGRS